MLDWYKFTLWGFLKNEYESLLINYDTKTVPSLLSCDFFIFP